MSSTAWEILQGATLSLTRAGSLKDRLTQAYRKHLSGLYESDLPRELRDEFRTFYCMVTRETPMFRGDDAFRATVRKMSNEEAEQAATCVVRMFSAIQRPATVVPLRERTASAQLTPVYVPETRAAEG